MMDTTALPAAATQPADERPPPRPPTPRPASEKRPLLLATASQSAAEAQRRTNQLYDSVKRLVDAQTITVASVVGTLTTIMVEIESLGGLTGPQKKAAAMQVLNRLIDEMPADAEEVPLIRGAVALLGPTIIDNLIAASKGQIAVNIAGRCAGSGCCGVF
jgi:hypothetical protein